MRRSRWWGRVTFALCAYAAVYALTAVLRWGPDPLRLALVVALVLALVELLVSSIDAAGPSWRVDPVGATGQSGRDAQFSTYLRVVEAHLTTAHPDPALRDRLGTLADRRLVQHHGVRRADERARPLLGPDLLRDLEGPPRRMSLADIDRHLTRIEEL